MISALFLDSRVNLTSCSAYESGPVVSPDSTTLVPTSRNELQFPEALSSRLTLVSFSCLPRCATVLGCETQKQRKQTDGQARNF